MAQQADSPDQMLQHTNAELNLKDSTVLGCQKRKEKSKFEP
jgi:hypothetical protein